jgi:hypothetical protein
MKRFSAETGGVGGRSRVWKTQLRRKKGRKRNSKCSALPISL